MSTEAFFAFARERHSIYLRRKAGLPRPWTTDPILGTYKFTNVFRELDATTAWFRRYVRDYLRASPDVLLATVLFRWFNRVTTGEAIFCQTQMPSGRTAWQGRPNVRQQTRNHAAAWAAELRAVIRAHCGSGPYVTGAYIIKGTDGMDKLSGILDAFQRFQTEVKQCDFTPMKVNAHWRQVADALLSRRGEISQEQVWDWLKRYDYLGPFTAYEVVTDLRHTALLDSAPDIMTWANPGPGANRGLARVHGRFRVKREGSSKLAADCSVPREQMMREMRELLDVSRSHEHWPQWHEILVAYTGQGIDGSLLTPSSPEYYAGATREMWPAWEMRDVEHTLCEFDKYERARLGQGKPKHLYRVAA